MQKGTVTVSTANSMELVDITARIEKEITKSKITDGLCHLYNPHTTAGLTINEGADPAVRADIIRALKKIIPFGLDYQHLEGNWLPCSVHLLLSLWKTAGCSSAPGRRFFSASLMGRGQERCIGA